MIGKTHPYSNIFIDMGANYGSSIEGAYKKGGLVRPKIMYDDDHGGVVDDDDDHDSDM